MMSLAIGGCLDDGGLECSTEGRQGTPRLLKYWHRPTGQGSLQFPLKSRKVSVLSQLSFVFASMAGDNQYQDVQGFHDC